MTFWQFLTENKVKILGSATLLVAALLGMISLGMFDATSTDTALIAPHPLRWFTIVLNVLNLLLGGGTVGAGLANTTRERVADAQASVAHAQAVTAQQMAAAINATPGTPVEVIKSTTTPPEGGHP